VMELVPADTRVFLFHSAQAAQDASGAMDGLNQWLSKDRTQSPYAHLRVRHIAITPDGAGGVYTLIVCSLGRVHDSPAVPGEANGEPANGGPVPEGSAAP